MGDINQNIRVRIDAALNGLPVFQQFGALLEKIKASSNQKIEVGDAASIAQTTQLANAVDNLGKKIDSLKPSKLAELSTIIQGLAAGSTFVKNIAAEFGGLKQVFDAVKGKASELVDGIATRAGPIIESITSKASGLAAVLPEIGAGGAAAAVGIGAVAAGTIALIAGIVALVAIVASITTAIVGFIPVLTNMALRLAETDAVTGKLQDRLRGGEIQAILTELKQRASDLADELARELIPYILQLLRVALDLVNQLTPVLRPFFDFVLFNIRMVGATLVWLTTRALAAGKAIAAAIAVGYATGSPIEAGKAAISTFNATTAELDKIANSPVPLGTGVTGGAGTFSGGGGGGGGGRGRVPRPEDTSQSQLALDRAVAEARFKQISDALDRENQLVREKYDQRKITISDYYAEVLRIEDEKLEAQEIKLIKELNAIQTQLASATNRIDEERRSGAIGSDAEAEAKKTNELNKAQERSVQLNAEINSLRKQRLDLAHDIGEKEKADTDALNERLQRQIDAMDQLRGLGPLVQARQQIAEIDRLIEEFSGDEGMVRFLEEWREVVGAIGQAEAAATRYQRAHQVTEEKIATLQEQGSRNLVARIISEERIRRLRQQELKDLQEVLKLQEEIAKVSNSPEVQAKIQQTKTRIEQLKNETRSVKDTIKDTFINSAGAALENFFVSLGDIISHTKTLGQAFREMALSIIQDLQRIIAQMLVMLIIKKLLGGLFGVTGIGGPLQGVTGGASGGGLAAGDFLSARPGGRLVWAAEGGHDELIVTTDPRHRRRTQNLLASFLARTRLFEGFDLGGWISAIAHPQFGIPALAAGDWISSAPTSSFAGAPSINVHFNGVTDYKSFKKNQAAIERDLARATKSGLDRFRRG